MANIASAIAKEWGEREREREGGGGGRYGFYVGPIKVLS